MIERHTEPLVRWSIIEASLKEGHKCLELL